MIRRLADRLANVELLGKAGELLEHQIQFRLDGVEKSKVGARLAVIRLLDADPDGALAALDQSKFDPMPADLARERRHLRARALAYKKDVDGALLLLKDDNTKTGGALRADVHWRAQRWAEAADELGKLLDQRWLDSRPLDRGEAQQVIKLAVAEFLSEDQEGLKSLQQRFGEQMSASEYKDMFKVIVESVDPSKTDFRDLAPTIADVDKFETFMDQYRQKLKSDGLSQLN